MFRAHCYFDEEVWESQGLVTASLEAVPGAWCCKKPLSTDMGPPTAGLAATIARDTTSVGQPQAAEGAQISSNHHSSLIFVWGGGSPLGKLAKPSRQTGRKRILGIRN